MERMALEVVVGTYDEIILGFRLVKIGNDLQVDSSFTDRSHAGCVKCVAISQRGVLASGGTDENIRLLDLKRKREMGSLVHHSGTITAVEFHKGFMFSGSEDGLMCLWKTHSWDCLRTFKGHKSAVHSVSVHPSGKLALTVGKDKTMHTWNLMTGKCAYVTNLKQAADFVKWSLEGDTYAVVVNNRLDVYSVKTTAIIASFEAGGRINCLEFLQNDVIVYGGEGGSCIIQNISQKTPCLQYDTTLTRVKGLCISTSPVGDSSHRRLLIVAGSDGKWIAYKLIEKQDKFDLEVLVEHNTNFRVTCLAVYFQPAPTCENETGMTMDIAEGITEESEPTLSDTEETAKCKRPQEKQRKQKRKFKGKAQKKQQDMSENKKMKKSKYDNTGTQMLVSKKDAEVKKKN